MKITVLTISLWRCSDFGLKQYTIIAFITAYAYILFVDCNGLPFTSFIVLVKCFLIWHFHSLCGKPTKNAHDFNSTSKKIFYSTKKPLSSKDILVFCFRTDTSFVTLVRVNSQWKSICKYVLLRICNDTCNKYVK